MQKEGGVSDWKEEIAAKLRKEAEKEIARYKCHICSKGSTDGRWRDSIYIPHDLITCRSCREYTCEEHYAYDIRSEESPICYRCHVEKTSPQSRMARILVGLGLLMMFPGFIFLTNQSTFSTGIGLFFLFISLALVVFGSYTSQNIS